MPKKKNNKHSPLTEKGPSLVDDDSVEIDSDEVEGKKYGRREIQSNWSRYRSESPRLEEAQGNKSEDFAALLNVPADCNYFRFKSEKNWESEAVNSSFGGNKLFNLDLELLSNGLASIPFYERVDVDKSILSGSDIENCNKKAEESMGRYKPILERYLRRLESENELPCLDKKELKVNVNVLNRKKVKEHSESSITLPPKCANSGQFLQKKEVSQSPTEKGVEHTNPGEEDLEDWLDSVLDD